MANQLRVTKLSVIEKLENNAYDFSFEQAIFILKKTYPHYKITFQSAGRDYLCGSELKSINIADNVISVVSDRMSFTSLNSPLPNTFIETIKIFSWSKKESLSDFINIFYNRLTKISYDISQRTNVNLQGNKCANKSSIGKCLNAFCGESELCVTSYAHLIWSMPHTALGLRSLLEDYFKCDVIIDEFEGKFCAIEDISYLGKENSKLGDSCVLGKTFFEYGAKIKIIFYNLSKDLFLSFQCNSHAKKCIEYLVKKYIGPMIDYKLEFIPARIIATKLDSRSILGCSSWLKSEL